jgi:hypothetical protein
MREVWHFGQADLASGCVGQANQQELPRKPQANLEVALPEGCQEQLPDKLSCEPH